MCNDCYPRPTTATAGSRQPHRSVDLVEHGRLLPCALPARARARMKPLSTLPSSLKQTFLAESCMRMWEHSC